MTHYEVLGGLATIIGFIGFAPYLVSTWRRTIQPHIFSWFLWGIFNGSVGAVQLIEGGGPGAWVNISGAIITLMIAALAYYRGGTKYITKTDWVAFAGAVLAMMLWFVMRDPFWSVILITLIDMIASYPTFRKGWVKPHDDMAFVFILSALKHIIGIAALTVLTVTTVLFPLSLVLTNTALVIMLLYRRRTFLKIE